MKKLLGMVLVFSSAYLHSIPQSVSSVGHRNTMGSSGFKAGGGPILSPGSSPKKLSLLDAGKNKKTVSRLSMIPEENNVLTNHSLSNGVQVTGRVGENIPERRRHTLISEFVPKESRFVAEAERPYAGDLDVAIAGNNILAQRSAHARKYVQELESHIVTPGEKKQTIENVALRFLVNEGKNKLQTVKNIKDANSNLENVNKEITALKDSGIQNPVKQKELIRHKKAIEEYIKKNNKLLDKKISLDIDIPSERENYLNEFYATNKERYENSAYIQDQAAEELQFALKNRISSVTAEANEHNDNYQRYGKGILGYARESQPEFKTDITLMQERLKAMKKRDLAELEANEVEV